MNWTGRIRAALPAADPDVAEELAQHARAMYDAARAEGAADEEAQRTVDAQIDCWRADAALLRRRARHPRIVDPPAAPATAWVGGLAQDVRHAVRLLRRQPHVALLVILVMAVGIGATTSLSAVAYGVLMKPLPWPDSDRLVSVRETRGGRSPRFGSVSNAAYLAWREETSTVEDLAGWSAQMVTISGAGEPERIRIVRATASLFRVIGARPAAGVLFGDDDERTNVAVVSESLWRQRFGGDPAAIGRRITLDAETFTVVGVMPDALAFPDRQTRAWVPMHVAPAAGNLLSMFEGLAKLRPGVAPEQAAAEGTARGRFAPDTGMTTMAIFGGTGPVEIAAVPYLDTIAGEVRRPLIVLIGAVLLLMAIATVNVAALQLARAASRRRELAIRAALGATAGNVVRQLVAESLLLAVLGGAAGIGLAWLLQGAAWSVLPADFPRVAEIGINGRIVLFGTALSMLTGVVFGLLPALRVRRPNLVASLAEDGTSPVSAGTRTGIARARGLAVAAQVAIASVLLVSALLLGRTFMELLQADRGYDAASVLSTALPLPMHTPERRTALLADLVERLAAHPAIEHAAFASETPLTPGGSTASFSLPPQDAAGGAIQVQASPRLVSPSYFAALGLRVLAGRPLAETDTPTSQPVVVVNDTFRRRYLDSDPLGAQIPMGFWGEEQNAAATIVGVVEDVRHIGAATPTLPELYFSSRQLPSGMRSGVATLLVRSRSDTASTRAVVHGIVRAAEPGAAVGPVVTLEERLLATSLARPRLYAILLAAFAAVALLVAGAGLFGVLSYSVSQRTRELGVRAAFGATRADLVALVLRQGIEVTVAGLAAGLLASLWLGRFLASLLYGVTPLDIVTYLAAPLILLAIAAVACIAPALRAARLDPVTALRS